MAMLNNQRVINVFHEHSWHELKSTWLGIFRLGAFHEILGCGRWQSSKKQRGCGAHFQASARAACNSPSFCNDLFFSVCLMSCRGRPTRYQHVSGVISINLIVLFHLSLAYFIIWEPVDISSFFIFILFIFISFKLPQTQPRKAACPFSDPEMQTRKDEVFRGRCVYGCNACGGRSGHVKHLGDGLKHQGLQWLQYIDVYRIYIYIWHTHTYIYMHVQTYVQYIQHTKLQYSNEQPHTHIHTYIYI